MFHIDMTVVIRLHKFSLHATIDYHGPSMYSGHYTASINFCKKHSIAMIAKLRSLKWLIQKLLYLCGKIWIDYIMVFGLEQEDGSFDYSHGRWHILSIPLKAGRGISAETCGLDDVLPPDDLGSGPCTPFITYIPHIIAAFLLIKNNSFYRHAYQRLVWPFCIVWFDTVWLQVYFQLYGPVFSMSWYGYRYHVILYIGQQHQSLSTGLFFWCALF